MKKIKYILFTILCLLSFNISSKAYDFTNLSSFEFIDMYYEYTSSMLWSIQQECETFDSSGRCMFNSSNISQYPLDNYNFKLFKDSGLNLKNGEEYQLTFYLYANKDILQYLRNADVKFRLFTTRQANTTPDGFDLAITKDGYQYKYTITFTANTSNVIGFALNNVLSTRFTPTSGLDQSLFDLGIYKYYDLKQLSQDFSGVIDEIQGTNDRLDNIDDTLKDENVDISDDTIADLESFLPQNGVITQLITLPLTLYQHVLNSINSSCSDFSLGSLYGTDLIIPCFTLDGYFGSFWNILDLMISGFFVYTIAKKMIAVFNNMSNLEEGDILD